MLRDKLYLEITLSTRTRWKFALSSSRDCKPIKCQSDSFQILMVFHPINKVSANNIWLKNTVMIKKIRLIRRCYQIIKITIEFNSKVPDMEEGNLVKKRHLSFLFCLRFSGRIVILEYALHLVV